MEDLTVLISGLNLSLQAIKYNFFRFGTYVLFWKLNVQSHCFFWLNVYFRGQNNTTTNYRFNIYHVIVTL